MNHPLKNVSRETFSKLSDFVQLLLKWNQKINLVSKKIDEEEIWQRHILDSAGLLPYIPENCGNILDLGSGAGFPGLIMAILTNAKTTLVESDQRKCSFLFEAINKLQINAEVVNQRIEDFQPQNKYDIVTSRALASLNKLITYSEKFLQEDNFMLFLKGQNVVQEIEEATIYWDFTYNLLPNNFSKQGNIIKISKVRRL